MRQLLNMSAAVAILALAVAAVIQGRKVRLVPQDKPVRPGPVGPAGPQGAQGPQGPVGP